MTTIAADPKRLGAKVGMTSVLHTWGSGLTHHPHVRMIVPGGGMSPDGTGWVACKPGFFLHVRVLEQELRADGEIVPLTLREPCPDCGGPMRIIEIFRRGQKPMTRAPPREQAA